MSTQLIEDEIIFEVTVQEDSTSAHLMVPGESQWGKINKWFGGVKLVHQMSLKTFQNRSKFSPDSLIGSIATTIVNANISLPGSAIGNKINELSQWIAADHSDAEDDDGQCVVLSGSDFEIKEDGTVWITCLGNTDVVLTAEQIGRVPVSVELFPNPMDDDDTVAMVITYRDEVFNGRHLTVV
jgi:hypothetical protein